MLKLIKNNSYFISILLITIFCFFFTEIFQWERLAIENREIWRIMSGTFSHNNLNHLVINLLSFICVYFYYSVNHSNKEFYLITFVLSLIGGISLLSTNYSIYVGMSGLIYGLIGYLSTSDIFTKYRNTSIIILLLISMKIFSESIWGADNYIAELINSDIAIESHRFFFFIGIGLAILITPISKKTL